jgi:hypothetical protein
MWVFLLHNAARQGKSMQGRSKPRRALPDRIWLGDVEVRPDNNEIVVRVRSSG